MKLFAFAMLMASSFTSVHALDLHPVQSLTLAVPADGRFDFDNVNIPAGVILISPRGTTRQVRSLY